MKFFEEFEDEFGSEEELDELSFDTDEEFPFDAIGEDELMGALDEFDDDEDFDDEDLDEDDFADLDDAELAADADETLSDAEPVPLSAEEKERAAEEIAAVVPGELVKAEMEVEEAANFFTSTQADILLTEGLMSQDYLDHILLEMTNDDYLFEADDDMFNEAAYPNKSIVKLSKKSILMRIKGICVMRIAKLKNDPSLKAYLKAKKIVRIKKAEFYKKYGQEATRQMKLVFARMRKSKSPVVKKLADKAQ